MKRETGRIKKTQLVPWKSERKIKNAQNRPESSQRNKRDGRTAPREPQKRKGEVQEKARATQRISNQVHTTPKEPIGVKKDMLQESSEQRPRYTKEDTQRDQERRHESLKLRYKKEISNIISEERIVK